MTWSKSVDELEDVCCREAGGLGYSDDVKTWRDGRVAKRLAGGRGTGSSSRTGVK